MTTTRRVLTGLDTAGLVISVLGAGPATAAAPASSYLSYPVNPGTYQVRVPAGNRNVRILDLGGKAHSAIVRAC